MTGFQSGFPINSVKYLSGVNLPQPSLITVDVSDIHPFRLYIAQMSTSAFETLMKYIRKEEKHVLVTAIGSSEGADRKIPFWAVLILCKELSLAHSVLHRLEIDLEFPE
jgi:hypothetical protein